MLWLNFSGSDIEESCAPLRNPIVKLGRCLSSEPRSKGTTLYLAPFASRGRSRQLIAASDGD